MAEVKEIAHKYRWVIMVVLWSAYIIVFVQRLSIGPLSPFLKEEMSLNNAQIGGLVSAAVFGNMASMLPAGWATDRFGIRRVLFVGEIFAGIFLLGMFLVPSYQMALIIMGIAGFGCGCLQPATTKGVLVWFPRRERAIVMGFKQTAVNVGGMLSAAILPTLAIAMGWRFGFLIIGGIAIAIGIMSYILYKDPPVSAISLSLSANDKSSVSSTPTPPSISLREFMKGREMWLLASAAFALVAVEFGVLNQLVLYLTEELQYTVITAGALLALTEGGGVLGKPGGGFLSDRVFGGSRKIVYMMWGGIACIMCLLIALFGDSLSWGLYPILFFFGVTAIGWGGLNLTLVGEMAGIELAGRVTAIVSFITSGGVALGPPLFGYIVDTTGSYQLAWFFCTGLCAINVALLSFVREDRRRM
ncbi:MFS transporter [Chloroflexota bacterium]